MLTSPSSEDRIVASVGAILRQRGETLLVVEASAGGVLQAALSAQPGASAWLLGGINCYHDRLKTGLLGLPAQTLLDHGAVSAQTVRGLAGGAHALSGADWLLLESGVYGPTGGSPEKPVGLVWIGVSHAGDCALQRYEWQGDRSELRRLLRQQALQLLLDQLQSTP